MLDSRCMGDEGRVPLKSIPTKSSVWPRLRPIQAAALNAARLHPSPQAWPVTAAQREPQAIRRRRLVSVCTSHLYNQIEITRSPKLHLPISTRDVKTPDPRTGVPRRIYSVPFAISRSHHHPVGSIYQLPPPIKLSSPSAVYFSPERYSQLAVRRRPSVKESLATSTEHLNLTGTYTISVRIRILMSSVFGMVCELVGSLEDWAERGVADCRQDLPKGGCGGCGGEL